MTQKEIDNELQAGSAMVKLFGINNTSFFLLKDNGMTIKITERQFYSAKERHEKNFDFKIDYSGLTRHIFKLKAN